MIQIPRYAARLARKANGALRQKNGKWEELYVDHNGAQHRIYVNPDKSAKRKFLEAVGKRYMRALTEELPQTRFVFVREHYLIKANGDDLIKFDAPNGRESKEVYWDHTIAESLSLDVVTIDNEAATSGTAGSSRAIWTQSSI